MKTMNLASAVTMNPDSAVKMNPDSGVAMNTQRAHEGLRIGISAWAADRGGVERVAEAALSVCG